MAPLIFKIWCSRIGAGKAEKQPACPLPACPGNAQSAVCFSVRSSYNLPDVHLKATASNMIRDMQRVVVLGASHKPERYSNQAVRLLREYGHEVIPVHPRLEQVEGLRVARSLDEIDATPDTLTMYVGPARSSLVVESIIRLKPGRVIFNPGSENPELEARLEEAGISFERACTLVLLRTGQF
jgi:predicted CoA-binding protein